MARRKSHQFAKNLVLVSTATLGLVAIAAIPAFASGTFQNTGSLNVARIDHTATLLANGEVLVAGGDNNTTGYLSSAEVYNPSTGKVDTYGQHDSSARRSRCGTFIEWPGASCRRH